MTRDEPPVAISPAGLALLKHFEACRLVAYVPVAGDVPTIGWGATRYADGRAVALGDRCSQATADELLAATLARDAALLRRKLGAAPATQPQFDALLCLGYNIGMGALGGSRVLAAHRAGDHATAAAHFADWHFCAGRSLPGLVARRAAEAALYASRA